jgi:hypothetical protein
MKVNLNDQQKKLLLETLAIAWQIEHMKGKDAKPIGDIIEKFAESLKEEGREHIFFSVFKEVMG